MLGRQPHVHRLTIALTAAATMAAAAGGPVGVAVGSSAVSPRVEALSLGMTYRRVSDERTHTASAVVLRAMGVRAEPDGDARRVGRVGSATYLGSADSVLVLGRAQGVDQGWSFVRYPGLGQRTGWVPTSGLGPTTVVRERLVIDRRRLRATLYRGRRVLVRAPIGVGAEDSPTPAGRGYVRERFIPRKAASIYGVLAFGLSVYSRYRTDWPGGGQVGLHGTNQPELIPGRISNGCIRLRNPDVRRLGRQLRIGTPVEIL
ncbi:MAG: L,D-transpeptidase family protein [Solirubrobacteraceae bacterium]